MKHGINEIEGLNEAMKKAMSPLQAYLQSRIYWKDSIELYESAYKSRDGFTPHSCNHGGIEITEVIPKCEEYNFPFIEFDDCIDDDMTEEENEAHECDDHCNSKMRIWFKYEGKNEEGDMTFYLYFGGGHDDAPYFRTKYESTYYESSFAARTIAELNTVAGNEISKLIKYLESK